MNRLHDEPLWDFRDISENLKHLEELDLQVKYVSFQNEKNCPRWKLR